MNRRRQGRFRRFPWGALVACTTLALPLPLNGEERDAIDQAEIVDNADKEAKIFGQAVFNCLPWQPITLPNWASTYRRLGAERDEFVGPPNPTEYSVATPVFIPLLDWPAEYRAFDVVPPLRPPEREKNVFTLNRRRYSSGMVNKIRSTLHVDALPGVREQIRSLGMSTWYKQWLDMLQQCEAKIISLGPNEYSATTGDDSGVTSR